MGFVSTYNTVSVGTSATLIMDANSLRKGSILFNTSAGTVYIGMDANVTTANGLPILQNGVLSNSDMNACWRGQIFGVVVSATSDCRFWEWGP